CSSRSLPSFPTRRSSDLATFNPLMGFVFGLGGLIIWFAGGKLVLQQHLSLGTLMAFFGYMGMFYGPVSALSMFSNWVTGFLSARSEEHTSELQSRENLVC